MVATIKPPCPSPAVTVRQARSQALRRETLQIADYALEKRQAQASRKTHISSVAVSSLETKDGDKRTVLAVGGV
jgi:hypothetical protein